MPILVIDDDAYILSSISSLLSHVGFSVVTTEDPREALEFFEKEEVDAVLTDIKMPFMSGMELLQKIRDIDPDVPVILMTAFADLDNAVEAIKKGAFDFILKPYRSVHLIHSVEKAVNFKRLSQFEKDYKRSLQDTVKKKTQELADALSMVKSLSNEVVQRLTTVAEYKDTETGSHIVRIALYARTIAEDLNMPSDFIDTLMFASPMHDIGKVGIPDRILLKPGRLSQDETEIIKSHTLIGENILSRSSHPNLQMAASIALNHHERWDGSGYPKGLKGDDIPVEGRIVMICDQYDALVSKRPYKPPFSHAEAFRILTEGDDRTSPGHFDPRVLKAFIDNSSAFEEIALQHSESEEAKNRAFEPQVPRT